MKQDAFGAQLRSWRRRRRMSQLDLGLTAGVSPRHVSFLESGRAKPSRSMTLQLCETLEVPHALRNGLLTAAGFAPIYKSRPLDDEELDHVLAAVDWMLKRHHPYPAIALDKHWRVVRANAAGSMMLQGVGLQPGSSLLEAILDEERMAKVIDNWTTVAQHFVSRLRMESAHFGGDAVLDEAADRLSAVLAGSRRQMDGAPPAVIATRYRTGDTVLSFFSTIAQFGTAEDIAIAEMKIELMFPADDATRQALIALAGTDPL